MTPPSLPLLVKIALKFNFKNSGNTTRKLLWVSNERYGMSTKTLFYPGSMALILPWLIDNFNFDFMVVYKEAQILIDIDTNHLRITYILLLWIELDLEKCPNLLFSGDKFLMVNLKTEPGRFFVYININVENVLLMLELLDLPFIQHLRYSTMDVTITPTNILWVTNL